MYVAVFTEFKKMHFWMASEQWRHKDQFYLQGCMSAWITLQDVDVRNGAMWEQLGSQRGRLLVKKDLETGGEFAGWDYSEAVDELFVRNGMQEVVVEMRQGDGFFLEC